MSLHAVIAGKLAEAKGDSHYLQTARRGSPRSEPVKHSHTGQDSVKQSALYPGGQKYNPGGNKTQADHVGPVNVICKALITTWRLCEAVCAGSQLSRQRRPDLLPEQRGPSHGDSLGNEIFSLLGILFELAASNKLRASQMLCLCVTPFSSGVGGRERRGGGGGCSQRSCVVYCHSCGGLADGLCVQCTQLADDAQWKCSLNCLTAHTAVRAATISWFIDWLINYYFYNYLKFWHHIYSIEYILCDKTRRNVFVS